MHSHGHSHSHGPQTSSVLRASLVLTFLYICVLIVAGVRAHSLALLSEAGHNVSDFAALLLSWLAVYFQGRPANESKTYGYARTGVLAAFVNAVSLVVIAALIFIEAAARLRSPVAVQPKLMMVVAALGVAMNGSITWLLARSGDDVNIRSAVVHMLGDTLSTAAVIVGAVAISLTGRAWIDPVLSIGIGVLILWSSMGIIRETLNILLEGTPRGLKVEDISSEIASTAGVENVHDLHVWSIGSEVHALSCHVAIADIPPSESNRILQDVKDRLAARFHIHHTTIQFEHVVCETAHGCVLPVTHDHGHAH